MAGLEDVFSEQERTNWLKSCLGLNIAKHALEEFVDREVKGVHTRIFPAVRSRLNLPATTTCTNCCTANLLKCPTQNVCKKRGKNVCRSMHDAPNKQTRPCSLKICDEVRDEIIKEHRFDQPSWKNTSAEQWESNHWEIAKCFLPPEGYIGVSSAHDTDFNGIISVMLNCKHFDSKVSFSIAQPVTACLLSKGREIGRAVRHNSDCKMATTDLLDAFSTLICLLSDSLCLGQDRLAQEAVRQLKQLQVDSLKITEAEMSLLLKNAQDTLNETKQVADLSMKEMKAFVEKFYEKRAALEDEDYALAVEDFVRRLKQHYTDTLSHVSISALLPSGDESLYKFYANPSICQIVENNDGKKHDVETYNKIFYSDEKLNKRIFLQGEAGMGKSTFAYKLILDWCNPGEALSSPSTNEMAFSLLSDPKIFDDVNTMEVFKLAFLITLRDSAGQREVTRMIKEQIIDMIFADLERENAYMLLNKIMQNEICLVVQDGLDEWRDPERKLALPILVSCYRQCTVLTTTRPWKLTDERIMKSQIDSLFEVKGVVNPYVMCRKVMNSFRCKRSSEFMLYVSENELHNLIMSPMLLSLIVSSWVDGTRLTGSRCEVYSVLIDGLFKKASDRQSYFVKPPFRCFQNTRYLQKHIKHVKAISKTAFLMLFCEQREQSLVISDQSLSKYLTKQQKEFALKTGILTERKNASKTYLRTTCSFVHKSVQEFLAAFHIAGNKSDIKIVDKYMADNPDTILENQIFIFLCGLNISAANKLSRNIDSIIDTGMQDKLESILSMYISGFIEAKANYQNPNVIDLKLSRIYSSEFVDTEGFLNILQMNKSNVKFLTRSQHECEGLPGTLICLPDTKMCWKEGVCLLDVSALRNLENLCTYVIHPKTSIQLDKLKVLELDGASGVLDLSFYPNLDSLILCQGIALPPNALNGLAQLKRLKLEYCKCEVLGLSSCPNLETVELLGEITLQSNDFQSLAHLQKIVLEECLCEGLDLSYCHKLEMIKLVGRITLQPTALNGLALLKHLDLNGECVSDQLDLSSCRNLKTIMVGGRISILPDGFHCIDKLKHFCIFGESRCHGLDLSYCHNLEIISAKGATSILQSGLCGLSKLNELTYKTTSQGLELASYRYLEQRNMSENITPKISEGLTLYNSANCSIENLTHLTLDRCKCEVLDVSSCISLEKLHLEGEITLCSQGLVNLTNLKTLILNCFCDGLDLSTCYNLENMSISENIDLPPSRKRAAKDFVNKYDGKWKTECHSVNSRITLISTSFRGFKNLESLKLVCKCDSLDVSMLANLKYLELGSGIRLLPKKLPTLTRMEVLILWTECEDLDLSSCQQLHSLYLGESVTLLPDGLRGLNRLTHIFMSGYCGGLDLSSCINIRYIFVGKQVIFKTTDLREYDGLQQLTLCCKCDRLDVSECHELLTLCLTESMTVSLSSLSEQMLLERSYDWKQCESSCYNYLQELCLMEPVHLTPHLLSSLKFFEAFNTGWQLQRLRRVTLLETQNINFDKNQSAFHWTF